jgi:hypothetical protein
MFFVTHNITRYTYQIRTIRPSSRLSDIQKRSTNQICVFGFAALPSIGRMPALWTFPQPVSAVASCVVTGQCQTCQPVNLLDQL